MLFGFVQNWIGQRANPIGVDFGSDSLRLAQVQWTGDEYRLIAAACADVPQHVRRDTASRVQFFSDTIRELMASGQFRGRQAILALPASSMAIQHLRIPKMDDAETKKALPWEARGKLPIDPSQALIRHLVAGEVYMDQEPKNEVIVMAAARDFVNQLLAAAAKAKLDVIGMNVEPKAIVDCFAHVFRRKNDNEVTNLFIDIGCNATRAVIARGQHIFFARNIPVGGDHFTRAAAQELKLGFDETKLLRIRMCAAAPSVLDEARDRQALRPAEASEYEAPHPGATPEDDSRFALLDAGVRNSASASAAVDGESDKASLADGATTTATAQKEAAAAATSGVTADHARRIALSARDPLGKLVEELDLCRRYYEATFPSRPVDRLVFIGGEARQKSLCQQVARELGIAAQLGDPLVRMGRVSEISIESGIDRRQPQPNWTIAMGLTLGASLTGIGPAGRAVKGATSRRTNADARG